MKNCVKDLNSYELVKQCCRCISICLKSKFYNNIKKKYGVNSLCKIRMNKYIKEYMKNRMKTEVSFRLIPNAKRRIHHVLNGKPKSSSTRDISEIDIILYKKLIEYQISPRMN